MNSINIEFNFLIVKQMGVFNNHLIIATGTTHFVYTAKLG